MAVQARVILTNKNSTNGDICTVTLSPVHSSDPDDPNYSYSRFTPSGSIQLTITNPAASDAFEFGVFYDVTFTPVGPASVAVSSASVPSVPLPAPTPQPIVSAPVTP